MGVRIRIKRKEGLSQQVGGRMINGVACIDAVDNDRGDMLLLFGSDRHRLLPLFNRAIPLRHMGFERIVSETSVALTKRNFREKPHGCRRRRNHRAPYLTPNIPASFAAPSSPPPIGTTIEWYDFFLYSTVTGLVFAKLFFPHSDPLAGTLEAFAIYAVGFIARPIGAAIFGHYGDRIGRKSTLIATLMLMGIATFWWRWCRPTRASASGARSS